MRRVLALLLLCLAACGRDPAPSPPPTTIAPPAIGSPEPPDDDVIERTNDHLQKQLPRPMSAADVESVLSLTSLVDDDGIDYATAAREKGVNLPENEWGAISARVAMAYAQLLFAEHDLPSDVRSPQFKADIEVVRPFKKRLDQMHEDRRAKKEKSIDRSGQMISLSVPEFVSARRENPENWEPFKSPVTERGGFRVKAGVGEQILTVQALGELGPKVQKYAILPGGYYLQDADGIVIRPTSGK